MNALTVINFTMKYYAGIGLFVFLSFWAVTREWPQYFKNLFGAQMCAEAYKASLLGLFTLLLCAPFVKGKVFADLPFYIEITNLVVGSAILLLSLQRIVLFSLALKARSKKIRNPSDILAFIGFFLLCFISATVLFLTMRHLLNIF